MYVTVDFVGTDDSITVYVIYSPMHRPSDEAHFVSHSLASATESNKPTSNDEPVKMYVTDTSRKCLPLSADNDVVDIYNSGVSKHAADSGSHCHDFSEFMLFLT